MAAMTSRVRRELHRLSELLLSPPMKAVLLVAFVLHLAGYLHYPAMPGNNPDFPLGWWGWFDQGNYIRSARALRHLNFAGSEHFYPPVYSLIAMAGLFISPGHPLFMFNALATMFVVYVLLRLANRYLKPWVALGVVFVIMFACDRIRDAYVVPWTSTATAVQFSVGLLGVLKLVEAVEQKRRARIGSIAVVGLCLGFVGATRPAESVVAGLLAATLLLIGWTNRETLCRSTKELVTFITVFISTGLVAPMLYLLFNNRVFKSPFGGYLEASSKTGIPLRDLPEKAVSLLFDGSSLYGEPKGGIVDQYPWLLIGIPLMVVAVVIGDTLLRILGAYVVAMFALYLPYGDLLPTGMWRFLNVHYFKLAIALTALLAVVGLRFLFRATARRRAVLGVLVGVAAVAMFSMKWDLRREQTYAQLDKGTLSVPLGNKTVDFIDVPGTSMDWTKTYFGPHTASVDGRELVFVREFRVLPIQGGARVLFIRPVRGKQAMIHLGAVTDGEPTSGVPPESRRLGVSVGSMALAFGRDALVGASGPRSEIAVGDAVSFGTDTYDTQMLTSGWSAPEAGGRWSDGPEAVLSLRLRGDVGRIRLTATPYLTASHPCQRVVVDVAGVASERKLCGAGAATDLDIDIPPTSAAQPRDVTVNIRFPDAISPQQAQGTPDTRQLGLRLHSLQAMARQ